MAKRKVIVLSDFDGTISTMDVADTIFTVYLGDKWDEIDSEWHKGDISMVELYEKCWSLTNIQENELEDFVGKIGIDEYFLEFAHAIKKANVPLCLVSDGFDYYIERIMNKYGLVEYEYHANTLSYERNQLTLGFDNQNPECTQCANCKRFVIDEKRLEFDYVIYIGNGLSDRCAAEHADLVFAKDSLREHCEKTKLAYVAYESFGDVIKYFIENDLINN
ncbi:MAG: MtnX-like HAD-IB family phosphatase [Rubrobacteridae bacterium]|nr:MtnX-like HAD-IB family phosphatase [Rubrobacteridae bacterium]